MVSGLPHKRHSSKLLHEVMKTLANRKQVIDYLHTHKADLVDRYRLSRIAIIGSFARNDFHADSDVDLIVRFEPNTTRLHELKQQLRQELEGVFGRRVEIASEKYLRSYYREQILTEAVYI